MKNLFSLIFFFACLSFASAQGTYVIGNVSDGSGNPTTDAIGYIEYDDCNQIYFDTLYVDNQGNYNYFIENNCTQGSIFVSFNCTNGSGNTATAQGFFSPATQTVLLDVVLDCSGVAVSDCTASFYQGDSLGYTILDGFVTGSAGPYTYAWYLGGNYVGDNQYLELDNINPGTYYVCLVATGTDGSICEYCEDVVINTNNDQCWVGFEQINQPPVGAVYQAWAQGSSANYTYEWLVSDQSTTVTVQGNILDMSNYTDGTYYICAMATGDNGESCESCESITIGTVDPCIASFTQVDSFDVILLQGNISGGANPYTYDWYVNGNYVSGESYFEMYNYNPGTYGVCLVGTGSDGSLCEYCDNVVVELDSTQCWTGFDQTQNPNGGVELQAWAEGNSASYTYEWYVVGLPTTFPIIGSSFDLSSLNIVDGTYTVCIIATGSNGESCESCQTITIGNTQNPCFAGFSQDGNEVFGWAQNGTAPFTYTWSDGSTGEILDISGYTPGTYTLCLYVTDANGQTCEYCDVIFIGSTGDNCLDWSVIDLAGAPCNFDYNPVCGCDGIEYVNACVAYYCYGILEWTDGPCNYTGGGNTNGNPVDTLCETTAEYFYYGEQNLAGGYDVFFFGFGTNADEFYWEMGDGTTYTGDVVNHTYGTNAFDSIQAYTACLTTFSSTGNDSCFATICETIILDSTPDGFIGGDVVEGQNLVGGGQVEKLSGGEGDPISEATVELQDVNGNIIAMTTTDENGSYSFSGLQFGDYFVHVNIDGTTHTPDLIQLRPVLQQVTDNSYEVTNGQIVSGIDGVSFASGINIAPNPTSGELNIALELSTNIDIRVVVTDILGKVVSQEINNYAAGNQLIGLDLAHLVDGIYLVSLQSNGEVYTTKVLKQ